MNEPMLDYVLANLRKLERRELRPVAEATAVPFRTLEKIANSTIEDPGVASVQRLHDYFREIEKSAATAQA